MDLGAGGRGKKRALDAAINLVPFIDLMAVTISFLIMTAIWTQIGRLQVSQAGAAATEEAPHEQAPLVLIVTERELRLAIGTAAVESVSISRDARGRLDLTALDARLRDVVAQFPDQKTITVQSADSVRYDDLVRIIDACIGAGLPTVSVSTAFG